MLPTSSCWAARGTALTRRELLHSSPSRKLGEANKGVSGCGGRRPFWQAGFHLLPPLPATSCYLGANAH